MGMVHLACHCSKNVSTDICILEWWLDRPLAEITARKGVDEDELLGNKATVC